MENLKKNYSMSWVSIFVEITVIIQFKDFSISNEHQNMIY